MRILVLKGDRLLAQSLAGVVVGARQFAATTHVFSQAKEALLFAASTFIDLAILGVHTPDLDGLDHCPLFISMGNVKRTIIISARSDYHTLASIRCFPFDGFIETRSVDLEELGHAVANVLSGRRYINSISEKALQGATLLKNGYALTRREEIVLSKVGDGSNDQTIAERLGLAEGTVRQHRFNITCKLRLADKGSLIRFALHHGFTRITPERVLYPGFQRYLAPEVLGDLTSQVKPNAVKITG